MVIKIGKANDNDYIVNDQSVSRHHAILRREGNGYLFLEDLSSTNGTYVNGTQILKKRISLTDKVVLGEQYVLNVNEALKSSNDYSEDFAALKDIYEKYITQKVKIQSTTTFRSRLFQALPFALPGIAGLVISFKDKGMLLFPGLFIAICAPTVGIYLGARQAAKAPRLLQDLANQFKIDYVCPKCGTFLGEIPWESLANKKQCSVPSCKANWTN